MLSMYPKNIKLSISLYVRLKVALSSFSLVAVNGMSM